jgi:hypothetical protein
LDLELPAEDSVQVERDDATVTGPEATPDPARKRWRIALPPSLNGVVRLNIRRPPLPDQPAPLWRVQTTTTQRLAPGFFESDFQFDIRVFRGEARRLAIDLDAGVQPRELVCPDADTWSVSPLEDGRSRLTVSLRAPWRQGRILLRTVLAPPAAEKMWVSPAARVVGAVSEGEKLEISLHPDLRFDQWSMGRFTPLPPRTDLPGWTVLTLQTASAGESESRPRGVIRSLPRFLRTRESWEGRIHHDRVEMFGDIQVVANRGAGLGQSWEVPNGWEVEDVATRTGDPEVSWETSPSPLGSSSILRIWPLGLSTPADNERYVIRLRSPSLLWNKTERGESAEAFLPLPRLLDGSGREGTLTIQLDPQLSHEPHASTIEPDTPMSFRGSIEARVRLRRRTDPLRVQGESRFVVGQRQVRVRHTYQLSASVASPQEIHFAVPGPVRFQSWRVVSGSVRIRSFEPRWPIEFFGVQVWRLSLDRPIKDTAVLELTSEPVPLTGLTVSLSMPQPIGVETMDLRASVRIAPGTPWQVETDGSLEARPPLPNDGWVEYVTRMEPGRRLLIRFRPDDSLSGRIAQASLTTTLADDGTRVCQVRLIVGNWTSRELRIRLPSEARLVSVWMGQKWLGASLTPADSESVLVLPWNPAQDWETVELTYHVPREPIRSCGLLTAEPPELPFQAQWVYAWRWPAHFVPLSLAVARLESGDPDPDSDERIGWMAEDPSQASVWLIHIESARLAAGIVGILLLASMLLRPESSRVLFALGLFVIGILIIWSPWAIWGGIEVLLAAGSILVSVFVGVSIRHRQSARVSVRRLGSTAPIAAIALALLGVGWMLAAPSRLTTVFLLPEKAGEDPMVLVPPSFLEELQGQIEQASAVPPLVLEAKLDGQASAREIGWTARLMVYHASDSPGTLPLRLDEVRLIAAELDDKELFPEVGSDRKTYEFPISGRGMHTLIVRFTSLTIGGPDHESRLTLSEFPICSATVEFPPGSTEMQFMASRGVQRADMGRHAPRLEADLGRIGVVQLRWRSKANVPPTPGTVESLHLWDVSETQARLFSVHRLRSGQGALRRVEFDVPASLELADVVIRPVDDPLNLFGLTSPRDWRQMVQGQKVRHRVEFAVPLTGQVQISLELIPRTELPERWIVEWPELVGDYQRETVAALQFRGVALQVIEAATWESVAANDFTRRYGTWIRFGESDRGPDLAFRRVGRIDRPLVVTTSRPLQATARQRVDWRLGPGRAEFQTAALWSGVIGAGPIEWEIPPHVAINEVRGERVAWWSRQGSLLQVWLRPQGVEPTPLSLDGFVTLPAGADPWFELPSLKPIHVRSSTVELAVSAREDWRLTLVESGSYRQYPTTEVPGQRWIGFADHPSPTVWKLHRADAAIRGDVLTVVEPKNRQFAFRAVARVDLESRPGAEMATCWLEVRHGSSESPRVQLPRDAEIRDIRPIPGGTRWIIDAPPGPLHISVVGQSLVEKTPFVSVKRPTNTGDSVRHFLVTAPGWRLTDPRLARDESPPQDLRSAALVPPDWVAWAIDQPDAELALSAQAGLRESWLEMHVLRANSGWLIRLVGWLAVEPAATLLGPRPQTWLSAQIDGHELIRLADSPAELPLPRGLHAITLVWHTETWDLSPPRLRLDGETSPLRPIVVSLVGLNPDRIRSDRPGIDTVALDQLRQETFNDFRRRVGSRLAYSDDLPAQPPPLVPTRETATSPYDQRFVAAEIVTWRWGEDDPPSVQIVEPFRRPIPVRILATVVLTLSLLGLIVVRRR